jgi:predicted amidophosphoribosyltransferase
MSGRVTQCKNCRRIFQSLGSEFCPNCADEMDANFQKVKNYVYDHPQTNVVDISEGTGIAEKTVLYFLKEGRLSMGDEASGLECEMCGKPITGGRFCKVCQNMFASAFKSVSPQQEKQEDADTDKSTLGKMHFKIK